LENSEVRQGADISRRYAPENGDDRLTQFRNARPHLKTVVRPRAEFHLAALIVKGEPGNVYLASALEYTGRHVQAGPIILHDDVRRISAVKALVGAVTNNRTR